MSEPSNFLKGQANGAEVLVPQLLLDGNYISYSSAPASPDTDGVEGLFKTAPDGLYYFSEGLWRKVPAYTGHWNDLTESTRFLQVDKSVSLSVVERKMLQDAVGLNVATSGTAGLVKGASETSTVSGNVFVNTDGSMYVPAATTESAGVVRVTDISATGGAPIVATKSYVDSRVSDIGTVTPRATTTVIGGFKVGGDITNVTDDTAYAVIRRSEQLQADPTYTATAYGFVRLAPVELVSSPLSSTYDDANVTATGSQPYVTTVSQVRSIVSASLSSYTIPDRTAYLATASTPGFVKPGTSMYIDADGTIGVVAAAVRTGSGLPVRGTVLVDNGDEESAGSDLSKYVPTVSAVRTWVQGKGYLSSIPVATSTALGGVKVNGGGLLLTDGTLSVQFPNATTTKLGCVMLDSPGVSTSVTKVPSSAAVNTFVRAAVAMAATPDATAATAGKVKVLKGSSDTSAAPYTAITASWAKSDLLASPEFTAAVASASTGWDGGTVGNPCVFNSAVQLNGLTTVSGDVQQSYSPTAVLNYRQIAALLSGGGGVTPVPGTRAVTRDLLAHVEVITPFTPDGVGWSEMGRSQFYAGGTTALQHNADTYPALLQAGVRYSYMQSGTMCDPCMPYMDAQRVTWGYLAEGTLHSVIDVSDFYTEDVTELVSITLSVRTEYGSTAVEGGLALGVYAATNGTVRSIVAMDNSTKLTAGTNVIDIPVGTLQPGDKLVIVINAEYLGWYGEAWISAFAYSATVKSTGSDIAVPWASYQPPAAGDVYGSVDIPNDVQVSGDFNCYDVRSGGDINVMGAVTAGEYMETQSYIGASIVQGAGGTLNSPGPTLNVAAATALNLRSSAISLSGRVTVSGATTLTNSLLVQGASTLNTLTVGAEQDPSITGTALLVKGKLGAREMEFGTGVSKGKLNTNGTVSIGSNQYPSSDLYTLSSSNEKLYWQGTAVQMQRMSTTWFIVRAGLGSYIAPEGMQQVLRDYDGTKFGTYTCLALSDFIYSVSGGRSVTEGDIRAAFASDAVLSSGTGLLAGSGHTYLD